MAKIFNAPEEIAQPKLDFANIDNYEKESEEYLSKLKARLQEYNPNGKNVGEIIKFPAADGYALYMVANMKPVELVHIPLGDAWNFQYAHLLKSKDVQDKIDQEKAMAKLFGGK